MRPSYEKVLKFNKLHDKLGRFAVASAPGGGGGGAKPRELNNPQARTDIDDFGPTLEHAMRKPPGWATHATVAYVTSQTNDPPFDAQRTGWTIRQWHKTEKAADRETKAFSKAHEKPRGGPESYTDIQTVAVKRRG